MLSEKGIKINFDENIVKELTVKPNKMKLSFIKDEPEPTCAYFQEGEILYIPRFFQPCKNEEWRKLNKHQFNFKGSLRSYQKEPIKIILNELKENGSMILSLGTGGGKTCMALYIMAKLGLKTLIIVNKEILLDQWKERISEFLGSEQIGIIQGKNIEMGNEPIQIAMLQTISKKNNIKYDHSFLIVDECHNIATKSFSNAFKSIGSKYQLGLSATPNRSDGLTKVLKWYFGTIKTFERNDPQFSFKKVLAISYRNPYPEIFIGKQQEIFFSKMLTTFANDRSRNAVIIAQIGLQIKSGFILILSDRISQLQYLQKKVGDDLSIIYAGKMGKDKKQILETAKLKKVVFSTYQMMAEGVDIPHLNVLILATPRSNVTQAIGRIGRQGQNCLLVDIVDRYEYTERQFIKREMIYKKQKYDKTKRVKVNTK